MDILRDESLVYGDILRDNDVDTRLDLSQECRLFSGTFPDLA